MQAPLDRDLQTRNSIYMMLTRSFITSYFILPDEDPKTIEYIKKGVKFVNENGYLHIAEPNAQQRQQLNNAIINRTNIYKSQHDMAEEIMDGLGIDRTYKSKLHNIIKNAYMNEIDRDKLYEIIKVNYSLMN